MACAAFHVASSITRSCGASVMRCCSFALIREIRLPVVGSLTIRTLFQTMRPYRGADLRLGVVPAPETPNRRDLTLTLPRMDNVACRLAPCFEERQCRKIQPNKKTARRRSLAINKLKRPQDIFRRQ